MKILFLIKLHFHYVLPKCKTFSIAKFDVDRLVPIVSMCGPGLAPLSSQPCSRPLGWSCLSAPGSRGQRLVLWPSIRSRGAEAGLCWGPSPGPWPGRCPWPALCSGGRTQKGLMSSKLLQGGAGGRSPARDLLRAPRPPAAEGDTETWTGLSQPRGHLSCISHALARGGCRGEESSTPEPGRPPQIIGCWTAWRSPPRGDGTFSRTAGAGRYSGAQI